MLGCSTRSNAQSLRLSSTSCAVIPAFVEEAALRLESARAPTSEKQPASGASARAVTISGCCDKRHSCLRFGARGPAPAGRTRRSQLAGTPAFLRLLSTRSIRPPVALDQQEGQHQARKSAAGTEIEPALWPRAQCAPAARCPGYGDSRHRPSVELARQVDAAATISGTSARTPPGDRMFHVKPVPATSCRRGKVRFQAAPACDVTLAVPDMRDDDRQRCRRHAIDPLRLGQRARLAHARSFCFISLDSPGTSAKSTIGRDQPLLLMLASALTSAFCRSR